MQLSRIFWIGFVFVTAAVIFVVGLLYLQDISLRKSTYSFTVLFENVQGLKDGDEVTMLGKQIGKVSNTQIIGQKIAVDLAIENIFAFNIPVDSKIEVKSEGLIGSKFIAITPGTNTKEFILPGETVSGLREYDFTEITPDIVPMTRDLSAFARRLKATLGEEEKDRIRQTIQNIESLTAQLDTLVSSYKDIVSENDRQNIQLFTKNLKDASEELNMSFEKNFGKIDNIITNIEKVSEKSEDMTAFISSMKVGSESFANAAEKLKKVLNKIDSGEGTVGKMVSDSTLHDNMNLLVNDIRSLVKDFKENPTKYMKAYWKGKK